MMMNLLAGCNCRCSAIDMHNATWIIICVAMICAVALVYIGCHFGLKYKKKEKKTEASTHITTFMVDGKKEIEIKDRIMDNDDK